MILLDVENKIILDTLSRAFDLAKKTSKYEFLEMTFYDFDAVKYKLWTPKEKSVIHLSIYASFYKDLVTHDVAGYLENVYNERLQATPDDGYQATIQFDLKDLPEKTDDLAMKAALLKRNCIASVFQKYFIHQQEQEKQMEDAKRKNSAFTEKELPPGTINMKSNEFILINAKTDRVTVVYCVKFKEADDIIIGRIFMQEFMEGRRKYQQAPQVLFSHKTPPSELESTNFPTGDDIFYITFVLSGRHTKLSSMDNSINLIYQFRNYFHYHIKCAKSSIHQTMRSDISEFIKIINRAKPETKTTERRAIDGRTVGAIENAKPKRKIVNLSS